MSFKPLQQEKGFRADLSGTMLILAQQGSQLLAVEDPAGQYAIDISAVSWYDEKSVSGRDGGVYGDIRQLQFDADADYAVFYFPKTMIPYMLPIRIPT